MGHIDETKIIDRESESETFRKLISLELPRRVLLVNAANGMGKTDLLRKFRLLADVEHRIAVAYVSLENFQNRPDVFSIIETLYDGLVRTGAALASFENLNGARRLKNTLEFVNLLKSTTAHVDLRDSLVSGAPKIAALMINTEHFTMPSLEGEAEVQAQSVCVQAFFEDLTAYAAEKPVVLLFDGFEKVGDELRNWVISEFVRRRALTNWSDRKLLVVLAGTDADTMVLGRLSSDERELIEPLPPFAVWDGARVRECLVANGISSASDDEVEASALLLKTGHDLTYVVTQARAWVQRRMAP